MTVWSAPADPSEIWSGLWILRRGFWMDSGYWIDEAVWKDGPDTAWSDTVDPGESWVTVGGGA